MTWKNRNRRKTYTYPGASKVRDSKRTKSNSGRLRLLLHSARRRARLAGLPFNIRFEQIVIPTHCPILDIPIGGTAGYALPNRMSLDRVDNSKGYVTGNVRVVSYKANALKAALTPEIAKRLVVYFEESATLAALLD